MLTLDQKPTSNVHYKALKYTGGEMALQSSELKTLTESTRNAAPHSLILPSRKEAIDPLNGLQH
jgi:hypothetical protein